MTEVISSQCAWCGAWFEDVTGRRGAPREYCSDPACRRERKNARQRQHYAREGRPSRGTCADADCGRPADGAKGLCKTHYNRTLPGRHPKVEKPCEACGKLVMRLRGDNHGYRTACSAQCRTLLDGHFVGGGPGWAVDAVARARKQGAVVIEIFAKETVLERDNWTCYLCGRRTDPDADPLDPRAPTVDHVIPLSAGGEHSLANVRCACYRCNSRKGKASGGLIGILWPNVRHGHIPPREDPSDAAATETSQHPSST